MIKNIRQALLAGNFNTTKQNELVCVNGKGRCVINFSKNTINLLMFTPGYVAKTFELTNKVSIPLNVNKSINDIVNEINVMVNCLAA